MEGKEMEEEVVKDMTPRLVLDLGMRYTTEKSTKKYRYGLYECAYCGKEFEGSVDSVKRGQTKSCGCLRGDIHGLTSHKFYHTWNGMVQRCTNPKNKNYKNYGGRGITVCEEWLDIRNFVDWAKATHPNIKGMTLDRIDNDKGYNPENCRWADVITQNINQRIKKNNTSGFVGICWNNKNNNWMAKIKSGDFFIYIGSFHTKEEAVLARDNYIVENKLPHKLSTDYMKDK